MLPLSIAQFLMQPRAPPRRMVSGCSVKTTILARSGSSWSVWEDEGAGKGGCGVSSRERVAGICNQRGFEECTHHGDVCEYRGEKMTLSLSLSFAVLDAVSCSFFECLNQRADRLNLTCLLLTHLGVGRTVSRIPKVRVDRRGSRGRSGEEVRRVVAGAREGYDGDGQRRKDGYE